MRISEAFCKMRLSDYCTSQDIDRAIAVTVDSFVGSQKVSCKKALARAFAKYVKSPLPRSLGVLMVFHRYTLARPGATRQKGQSGRGASRGLGRAS
jgi:DNA replication licensing factor MCM2